MQIPIAHGADVGAKDENGDTALTAAANSGVVDIVKLLVAHGAKLSETNSEGKTALDLANREGDLDTIHYLMSMGASVHSCPKFGGAVIIEAGRAR